MNQLTSHLNNIYDTTLEPTRSYYFHEPGNNGEDECNAGFKKEAIIS